MIRRDMKRAFCGSRHQLRLECSDVDACLVRCGRSSSRAPRQREREDEHPAAGTGGPAARGHGRQLLKSTHQSSKGHPRRKGPKVSAHICEQDKPEAPHTDGVSGTAVDDGSDGRADTFTHYKQELSEPPIRKR
eukprot:TRINITY_DN28446_c1_g1_i1.p1 TRINITY_DN28446_c1_g1~~TRINITY_DN28446_c1_g1_i1.p1  ORF type:complete len:134 (+),score=8.07 TRINITY_DN28446_c1_g1_i1:282-683(+)